MSDTQKPVEETPVAAPVATEAAPATTETPAGAAETPAAEEAPKETPAEESKPAATEETAEADKPKEGEQAEAKEETKTTTPATDGVLGYKAPGLVKGLRFAKRYFWFSDEAVEVKNLTAYFANEKHSISHPTGAWASQTGKGLLFFTKRAEDKATPTGIINLVDVTDVAKDSGSEFHFKFNGNKHTFQANSAAERDSWVAALEAKVTEAKAEKESVVESEGYKAELEKMTKPPVLGAAASAPKKSTELKTPKEEKPETEAAAATEDKKEEKAETPKETQKSRSQSRKRASIFGNIFPKKEEAEEKKDDKKEEKPEAKEETKATEEAAEAAAPAEAATTEAAAEPVAETTEAKPEEKKEEKTEAKAEGTTSTKNKRASIFGNFFQKVGSPTQEKSEKESAPAVPAKDKDTPVSNTAPQLGDPVDASASKPIEPESVTSPTEGEASKTTEAGTSPSSKSGLLSFIKKDGKKETKTEEKAKPEDKTEEAAATDGAAASEPAQSTPKDKRRTSMFGSLGTKKEKKTTESDGAESDSKPKSNKLGGLFRKPSKAVKPTEKKEETTPTETEAIPEGGDKTETTEAANGVEATEEKKETIGDVSADSVNVGPSNTATVQAAA